MSLFCYNEACTKDFLNLEQDVITAKKVGFDIIELRFDCINRYLENHSLTDLKNLLTKTGLKLSALNALYIYPEFLGDNDIKDKHDALCNTLKQIEELHDVIGINECIVVAPLLENDTLCANYKDFDIKAACTKILKHLATSMPYIRWIFEPVGLSRSLVQDADYAYQIIKEVNCENVGLVLDSYNLYLKNRNDAYSFKEIDPKKVFAIHLMNGQKIPNDEPIVNQRYRTLCDEGDAINLNNFLNALSEINYKGMISTEVFNPNYPKLYTQEEIIQRAYLSLKTTIESYEIVSEHRF